MRLTSLLALLLSTASAPLGAQAGSSPAPQPQEMKAPFVKEIAEASVRELAQKLEDNFVFPDKGKAYAAMLRANLEAGRYAGFADQQTFAATVTEDLQAVHKDGHLRLHIVPPEARRGPAAERSGERPRGNVVSNAVSKSGWIADGVAYIRFEGFPGNDDTMAAVRAFLDAHKGAETLIIDARTHRGGGLSEMDELFAQMFADPVLLVGMDTRTAVEERRGSPISGHPTLREVDGPDGVVRREHFVVPAAEPSLAGAKVFLLTSNRTGSAGEHFALALKRTKRATLIGETTAGAGHYGGMEPLDKDFTSAAFIPVGRTFDPDTGEGWEGVGVKPDVEVAADQAFGEALKRAGLDLSEEEALAALN